MKYLIILSLCLIACNKEAQPLKPQAPDPVEVERLDPEERLCRMPEKFLQKSMDLDEITSDDIRRCRPLKEYEALEKYL